MKSNTLTNCLVGFAVGVAGGVIGLGGAELRLPYLVGVLRLTAHQAVPVNLAVSLFTIAAAIPARFAALHFENLAAFASETAAIAVGATIAAYLGVSWLHRLSPQVLSRIIFVLLTVLGAGMITESFVEIAPLGFLPLDIGTRIAAGLLFGFMIGAISSLLGVAGGRGYHSNPRLWLRRAGEVSRFALHAHQSADRAHRHYPSRKGGSV
jgi:uncharacterized membrane protein YfcA